MEKRHERLGLIIPVLPVYRRPTLENVARKLDGSMHIFAGRPAADEGIGTIETLAGADTTITTNRQFFGGPLRGWWQVGIKEWIRQFDPTVIIVEANPRYLSTWWAMKWMRKRGRPSIGWGLGTLQVGSGYEWLRNAGRDQFLHRLNGILAYSQRAGDEYRDVVGIPPERIVVARNATTPRQTWPMPQRPDSFNGKPVVLFVGRLLDRKRIDNLMTACAKLPENLKPVLNIVGTGPAEQPLRELSKSIYPETKFFGERRGEALKDIWQSADLFILPGLGGLAMQEAMSHGLPVIAAEGDGTQFDLVDETNGWHVEPRNVDALRETIAEALSDVSKLRRMGEASYRKVYEQFNVDYVSDQFLKAINLVNNQPD